MRRADYADLLLLVLEADEEGFAKRPTTEQLQVMTNALTSLIACIEETLTERELAT